MAILLAQVDDTLVLIDPETGDSQVLDLPDSVTIDPAKKASIATLKLGAAIVNSPSRNLLLDKNGELVLLVPSAPATAPTAAVGSAGVLTGDYAYVVTFVRKDADDNIITESPMSVLSNVVTTSADQVNLTSIPTSTDTDTVTGRRLYRTLSGGAVLYHLVDIDDNSTTTYTDNALDASLSILPEQGHIMEGPPGTDADDEFTLRLIVSWKNRLWAVADNPNEMDVILYTEDGLPYRWWNQLRAYPEGQEVTGVVGFAARRDQLGILKQGGVWQITGDSDLSFGIVQIAIERGGCLSAPSVVVIGDDAFWHGPDGVNWWSDAGVLSVTDDSVKPWFNTDRYFDRSEFPNSFAKYNQSRNQYELHLVEAGETESAVWVAYSRDVKAWYGIHRTTVDDFTCASKVNTASGVPQVIVGSASGQIYKLAAETFHDGAAAAISMRVKTPKYAAGDPGVEHVWGRPTVITQPETKGQMLVQATLGRIDAAPQVDYMGVDLTEEYAQLRRLGKGVSAQLEFIEESVDQPVSILGFDLPGQVLGKR